MQDARDNTDEYIAKLINTFINLGDIYLKYLRNIENVYIIYII